MSDTGPLRLMIQSQEDGRAALELATAAIGAEQARDALRHGGIWINRVRVERADHRLQTGDTLFIHRPPAGHYEQLTFDPAWIIYEDDDLLAVNKPAGVYVEATPWDIEANLRAAAWRFLVERAAGEPDAAPNTPQLHLAHRLDRDTTGTLVLSKRPQANPALQRAFERGSVSKSYVCLCQGEPSNDSGTLETGHGRMRQGLFRVYSLDEVGQELPGGSRVKRMVTRFEVERRLGDAALVRAFPISGRTHQIRLHLAHLGHPLLGDARYGGPVEWRGRHLPYHLLHAERLELPHPRSGVTLILQAPRPDWATEV